MTFSVSVKISRVADSTFSASLRMQRGLQSEMRFQGPEPHDAQQDHEQDAEQRTDFQVAETHF